MNLSRGEKDEIPDEREFPSQSNSLFDVSVYLERLYSWYACVC